MVEVEHMSLLVLELPVPCFISKMMESIDDTYSSGVVDLLCCPLLPDIEQNHKTCHIKAYEKKRKEESYEQRGVECTGTFV
jgi:hypothetical protein